MPNARSPNPEKLARELRRALKTSGSAEHANGVQWFFKQEVRSHGWYTGDLRRFAHKTSRELQRAGGDELLLKVADRLFRGDVLEEKVFAVLMLEKPVGRFGDGEFKLFESWLDRVTSWADHDGLVHYLLSPLAAADPSRAARAFRWTKSRNRWRRRAAAVSLIRGARQHLLFRNICRTAEALLGDRDDMVQKGLGWLLREAVKADAAKLVPYLMKIRNRAPRLVLRTACETLPQPERTRVLLKSGK